jgi:hypothetical protein
MPGIDPRGSRISPHKGGGGIFGSIGHVLRGTGKGLYHGITGAPTGAYMVGRSFVHDAVHNPTSVLPQNILMGAITGHGGRTAHIARNVAKQEYNSYRHFGKGGDISGPLLDASALLTGGASLVARGTKTASEISKAAQAAREARATELATKDAAVSMAKRRSGN